jgi:predicted DsbA family dithiol-disulfide isomerase
MIRIHYFSDVLCIWAYVAEARLEELRRHHADQVSLDHRFVPVFGSLRTKIERGWSERGGLAGYAAHVHELAERFDQVQVHPEVWTRATPVGSSGAHAFVKAASLVAADGAIDSEPRESFGGRTPVEQLTWQLRLAFFRDARDIARQEVQLDVARALELPVDALRERLEDGRALAALAEDYELASRQQVTGSPTYLLNEDRQRLYGNVGYRIIEANVLELLRDNTDPASWC